MKTLAFFCSLLVAAASAQTNIPADAIYYHGNILTGVDLESAQPQRVSAIAVRGGLIVGTGSDADLKKLQGPSTKMVDLGGAFVMPGFNDAHAHLGDAGRIKLSVDVTGVKSLTEMQTRVKSAAKAAAPGAWLTGGGWDHTLWQSKTLPTKADLDKVTEGHPAFLVRVDGHIAIGNTAALAAAEITKTTPDPQGGKIDRDANGEATGIIRETAQALIDKHIPPPSPALRRRGIELALADAVEHGVTSVQDFSDWQDFLVYEQLEKEGKLPARVSEWLPFNDSLDQLKQMRKHHPADDPMLHTSMLKGFMDGSLGSRTAALKAPYSDDPGNSGIPRYQQAQLNQMAIERAQAGFQMGFHAIGDRAVSMALDAFAAAQGSGPLKTTMQPMRAPNGRRIIHATLLGPRNRIEHSQVVDPADFARYKQLGVIASMQPNHLLTDMAWAEQRLGSQRARYAYAWKSFLDAGVPLAFGTDYPVEPITPFRGMYAAVTRMNEAGTQTYFPEEKLTIWQALYAYTQGSAYAEFGESKKGKLANGYYADFVVLDRDITSVAPPEILKTQVLRTVVSGQTVYQAGVKAR
ncbi:amidohydrolase [Alloacidobacterium sp.]|uniref:amidohydrolase n=1 Tax=Alloacidobacterium sp. TaxID=2951999 RepID=UPI002D4F008A|nr:amidohydrolase [Alloacidobacterium sp.]HYK36508.1 amidohydrolase [Alloacidobacterium sp.]